MQLRNRRDVWGFVVCVTGMAVALALIANLWIYGALSPIPAAELQVKQVIDALITTIIALPISLFVGDKIQQLHVISEELVRLAERDRLTDLATREHFFDRLREMHSCNGIVLMIDIDHFKQVNDSHGHIAGDQVLRHVAATLREAARHNDLVSRFGGEEFLVFLHGAGPQVGLMAAERIRMAVAASTAATDAGGIRVTVSVGLAARAAGTEIDVAIRAGDDALYGAKRNGRNRTVRAARMPVLAAPVAIAPNSATAKAAFG